MSGNGFRGSLVGERTDAPPAQEPARSFPTKWAHVEMAYAARMCLWIRISPGQQSLVHRPLALHSDSRQIGGLTALRGLTVSRWITGSPATFVCIRRRDRTAGRDLHYRADALAAARVDRQPHISEQARGRYSTAG